MIIRNHPSVLVFLILLGIFTLGVTLMSEAMGTALISTSFVKTLGKTLCLAWSPSRWTWSGAIAASSRSAISPSSGSAAT